MQSPSDSVLKRHVPVIVILILVEAIPSGSTLLDLLVTARYTLPLYFATTTGQNVSAGPYQVTLNFSVTYNICAAGVGICLSPQTDTVVRTLQLNLTVTNDCITITAPNVNFGSAPLAKTSRSLRKR